MKHLWLFLGVLFFQEGRALALTVTDVKVSVTSDSAAAAREKALEDAHGLAFQKLLKEYYPESSSSLPPSDTLLNMVSDFSIDREKTTPQSYTASLTFQFDDPQVQAWLQQDKSSSQDTPFSSSSPLKKETSTLKIRTTHGNLPEWHHMKKMLERSPGVQKLNITRISSKNAEIEVTYRGGTPQIQQYLQQQDLILTPQGQEWLLSSSIPSPSPKTQE